MLDLLTKTRMFVRKPVDTPIKMNHKLGQIEYQTPMDKGCYHRLVGKLLYLSHTLPDIAYVVCVVSHFMYSLGEKHM